MKNYWKFTALVVVILATLVWLAVGGTKESQAYYKSVAELQAMKDAEGKRVRVGGDVEPGSIRRTGREVRFVLTQDSRKLNVVYNGIDPLPDTFKDNAQALADGRINKDGVFVANKIQAKCASKYEAKPGGSAPPPTYQKQAGM